MPKAPWCPSDAKKVSLGPSRERLLEIREAITRKENEIPFILFAGGEIRIRVRIVRFLPARDEKEILFQGKVEGDQHAFVSGSWSPRTHHDETRGSGWIHYTPSFNDLGKTK